MSEYTIAWAESDNPDSWNGSYHQPYRFRVFRWDGGSHEAVTPPLSKREADEKLRMIRLLDPPAQRELDLWQ